MMAMTTKSSISVNPRRRLVTVAPPHIRERNGEIIRGCGGRRAGWTDRDRPDSWGELAGPRAVVGVGRGVGEETPAAGPSIDNNLNARRVTAMWRDGGRPSIGSFEEVPDLSPEPMQDARLGLATATGVTANRAATSAGSRSSTTVSQNICQVRSSNSPRTSSRARRYSPRSSGGESSSGRSMHGSGTSSIRVKASLPPLAGGTRLLRRKCSAIALRVITRSHPRKVSPGRSRRKSASPTAPTGRPPAPRR